MTAVACPFCGSEHTAGTFVCPVTNRRLQGLLPVNTLVDGKYRIDGIIGVGGMGVVYRAENAKISRLVALKMLLPEYIVYPDLVARVEREARTAGQINHPNVVSIVDLGNASEFGPYIAMELLHGQELATEVENAGGRLDPAEAVDIMRQVLAGLDAAHRKGVIHRDLKPENIFLAREEDGARRVKVLDFGISKLRDDSQLNSLTRTGTVMGTPQFMAPEQAAGARDQDVRIDLYAAGAVLYAVLCNGLPYEAENYNLLINEILNKAPIQILHRNPQLDPRLAGIVMKAIAKRADARFQTAREMADALTLWYDHREVPYTYTRKLSGARAATFLSADTPAFDLRAEKPSSPPPVKAIHLPVDFAQYEEFLQEEFESAAPGESTQLMAVPFRGDDVRPATSSDEFFDDGHASTEVRPSQAPGVPTILLESPLDAPPIVLPQAPKPPPSADAWEKLRIDHPLSAGDALIEDAVAEHRWRSKVLIFIGLAVLLGMVVTAVYALSPGLLRRITGDNVTPPPPQPPPTVQLVDPSQPPSPSVVPAPSVPVEPTTVDAGVAAPSVEPSVVPSVAPSVVPAAAMGDAGAEAPVRRRRHRHHDPV